MLDVAAHRTRRYLQPMSKLKQRPWLNTALALLCIAAIVVAYTTVGQASQGSAQGTRTATAQQGVVQSTVSGSGNIQAASQLNLGFKTSGSITQIYVTEGQRVTKGKLLATLDPQSAEVTLEQAKASLQSAEANLAAQEAGEGQASSSQGSTATTAAPASTASVAANGAAIAYIAANAPATTPTKPTPTATTPTATAPTSTAPSPTTTPATTTAPATGKSPTSSKPTTTTQKSETTASKTSGSSSDGASQSSGSSSSGSTISPATREANLASAKAAVKSDKLTVQSDEQAVQNTKLYAPQDGTIVALSGEVGETVSATGTTKASTASSSSKSSSSTGATASGSSPSSSTGSSSSSASSSSSSFAVLSNLGSMQLVVPLSESEIGNVKIGQTATVTIEALSGRKVAAHVLNVDALSTSNSGVVSYNVTFQLDQMESGLKVGMSATAEVVVKQAEGVNVPTTAISAGSVTVVRGGKHVSQAVTTGLAGDSSTIILSGLKAGEEVVLPSTTSTTTSSSSKAAGARIGGLGAGGGLGGAGGGAFLRGGPPGG
jgi:multidrug efflux pump subunit AcrA (membrane-fusion protein)